MYCWQRQLIVPLILLLCALPVMSAAQPKAPANGDGAAGATAADAGRWTAAGASRWLAGRASISALWYLHYGGGEQGGASLHKFSASRGYTTLTFEPAIWFEGRSTVNLFEGDHGWELRFKYLYGRFKLPVQTALLSDPYLEFGQAHIPWLSFEEQLNRYRMQGTMFLERNDLFNSADFGVTAGALLGPRLSPELQREVGRTFAGTYGSVAVGVYNGGGYHASELNLSKVLMARLSLRPLGSLLPHLQASYLLVHGRGNTAAAPHWDVHNAMLSFNHPRLVVTGQAALGRGDQDGERIDADGSAQAFKGASGFTEVPLPWAPISLFGRYDWFRWAEAAGDQDSSRVIGGVAYFFLGQCAVVADGDWVSYSQQDRPADWRAKLTLQVLLN